MKRFKAALVFAAVLLMVCGWTAMAEEEGNSRLSAPDQPGEEDIFNRELWQFAKRTPYEAAERHIKKMRKREPAPAKEVVLPTGWKIAPAGRQLAVGRLPEEAVFYNKQIVVLNTGYYTEERQKRQEISIVDPASGKVKALLPGSLFPGAAAGLDGDLYISGGLDQVIYRYNHNFKLAQQYPVQGYAAGLAPIDADHLAVVYLVVRVNPKSEKSVQYGKGKLAILNTKTGKIELEAEAGYFPHTVRYLNQKLYVTILGEDKLQVYEAHSLKLLKSLDVSLGIGKTPQDICPDPQANRLYVVNTGSDNLAVVDAGKDEVVSKIRVGRDGEGFGCGPTSCAVDGDRLYVTLAYTNAVGIFDKRDGKRLGFIPTGWYPTKVITGKEGVAVVSAKGIQARRPNVNGEYVLTLLKGTLGIIPRDQIEANLPAWTRQVEEGAPLYGFPKGVMPPIRHVFFIVRENRTYDQVLGDLGQGNGDPYLTLFGEKITPNAHKLAKTFVTLDNYYADGEISVLGHSFTTSGYASPFLELISNLAYSDRYGPHNYPFGCVPALGSPKYLWDALEEKHIDYRIYGENYFLYKRAERIIKENFGPDSDQEKQFDEQMMVAAANMDRGNELYKLYQEHPFPPPGSVEAAQQLLQERPGIAREISKFLLGEGNYSLADEKLRRQMAEYIYHYPIGYRSWDLGYSDLDRVKVWKADFENQLKQCENQEKLSSAAQFHYIWLPNDHTAGTKNFPQATLSPDQLVAQNDAALGLIIDTISHSPIWKESLILITEDDAQDGPDHVDATRTVGLAVGPYVKRGAVVSDRYDQLSMLRTMEVLLGLEPLNQNDALAVPMFSIFSDPPDYTPYEPPPPSDALVAADRERYGLMEGEKKQP